MSGAGLPVVVIDDERAILRVIELVLGRAKIPCRTFFDPREALEFLTGHPAAVVVCDYRMPAMTGLEVLERLAEPPPFYLLTGEFANEERFVHPRLAGALQKPIRPEALLELVRRHVGREAP